MTSAEAVTAWIVKFEVSSTYWAGQATMASDKACEPVALQRTCVAESQAGRSRTRQSSAAQRWRAWFGGHVSVETYC